MRHDGRANPRQLDDRRGDAGRRSRACARRSSREHEARFGAGRRERPRGRPADHPLGPLRAARTPGTGPSRSSPAHHPVLDRRFPAGVRILTDEELDRAGRRLRARRAARAAGRLRASSTSSTATATSATSCSRPATGRAATAARFENRTRFLRTVVEGIRAEAPGPARRRALLGLRRRALPQGRRRAAACPRATPRATRSAFGVAPRTSDLDDGPRRRARAPAPAARRSASAGSASSAGSPYYNPHLQRPALFPPSDGYLPPEDPLARRRAPDRGDGAPQGRLSRTSCFVGSAYSYLQEWLPNVAQRVLREGRADFVGLGRMVLSYPELPADVLAGRPLDRKRICRTFSDCTTAPRNGLRLGLLSARPLLRRAARGRAAEGDQGRRCGRDERRPGRVPQAGPGAGRRHRLLRPLLDRRLRPLRPALLLRLLRRATWAGRGQQVTSGNALSKLVVGPLFGFLAGMVVDRFGPRRLMLVGILHRRARPRRPRRHRRRSSPSTPST